MKQINGNIRVSMLDWLSLVLVIVGAINWGLVGLGMWMGAGMSWNLVAIIFGSIPTLEALVYVLVGLAGVYELIFAYQLYTAREHTTETSTKRTT